MTPCVDVESLQGPYADHLLHSIGRPFDKGTPFSLLKPMPAWVCGSMISQGAKGSNGPWSIILEWI